MVDAHLGTIGVWLAFLASVAGVVVIVTGFVTRRNADGPSPAATTAGRVAGDGRLLAPVMLVGALLAAGAMEHALVTHDFTLVFVAENNSTVTPLLYSITGMWSALAGSILLWGLILAVVSTVFVWRYRRQVADPVIRWASLVLYVVSAFFFGLMVGPANPFVTAPGATQGLGPNSLLQDNPLVAIHPPLLYVGFVVFTVPFAFAIGMLATGRVGDRWQIECRRWTLVAFTFLSVGIVLGAWWSYQVLGWGGFWGWDPVENAALLPWLCGTAYLHSVLVQERRGLMRVWNLSLSIATFALTILGTFLTRSGVITSVHAFSESSLGPLLIGFFFAVVIVGFGLIAWRGDRLRSPGGIDAPLGREGAFLLNNVLFVGFAFVVLLGTLYPLLYEALTQQQVTVGAPFFNTIAVPVGLTLLFLMAVAPVLSWRKMSGAVLWQRLVIPVWIGVGTVVLCVAFGLRGSATLIGFGLGAMAAATAATRVGALGARRPHAPRRLVARPGGARQRRHDRPPRRRAARRRGHRRHVVPSSGRAGPAPRGGGRLRRAQLPVRRPAHCDVAFTHLAGSPGQGGRRHVHPGDDQLRQRAVGGRHAGHRLGALRRRLPHLRRRGRARRLVGQPGDQQPAAGVRGDRRRDRAARGLAVGRRSADRARGPARPGAGDPPAPHRPGICPLGSGDGHGTATSSPSGTRPPSRWGRSWPAASARHDRPTPPPPDPLGGGCGPPGPRRRRRRPRHPDAPGGHRRRQPAARPHRAPGSPAPISTTGLPVSLASLRGHYVVVNFFASWCVPCQEEAPDLARFHYEQTHTADGADMVSVVFHDTTATARAFLRANGDLWPAVSDPGGTIAEHYGVTAPPTTFVISPSGRVTAVLEGPATQKNLDSFLRRPGRSRPRTSGG